MNAAQRGAGGLGGQELNIVNFIRFQLICCLTSLLYSELNKEEQEGPRRTCALWVVQFDKSQSGLSVSRSDSMRLPWLQVRKPPSILSAERGKKVKKYSVRRQTQTQGIFFHFYGKLVLFVPSTLYGSLQVPVLLFWFWVVISLLLTA